MNKKKESNHLSFWYNDLDEKTINIKGDYSHRYWIIIKRISEWVNNAEGNFLNDPKNYYSLEKAVKATTESISAVF